MRGGHLPLAGLRVVLCLFMLLAALRPAAAELRIDITRGVVEPLPIAIVPFEGGDGEMSRIGRDIAGVISADLDRSGLFRPIDERAFIQTQIPIDTLPKFAD